MANNDNPKFIQVSSVNGTILALDESGTVWFRYGWWESDRPWLCLTDKRKYDASSPET